MTAKDYNGHVPDADHARDKALALARQQHNTTPVRHRAEATEHLAEIDG